MNIKVPSYAKINWFLDIIGRRPDGFHELLTLFQAVDLSDTLLFDSEADNIELEVTGRALPGGRDNLVYRAAELLKKETGCRRGARIMLNKLIPAGGGLGGGSGNAAVTLLVLNYLWDCGLGLEQLKDVASELGSDVPYFLTGGPCIGWGRGEKNLLQEQIETERDLVILFPGFQIPTSLAYSLLNKPDTGVSMQLTTECLKHTIRRSEEIISLGNWAGMSNDFEGPVLNRFPELENLVDGTDRDGSGRIMLSGSGSCFFAAGETSFLDSFSDRAKKAERLPRRIEIFRCRTLSRGRYLENLKEFFDYAGLSEKQGNRFRGKQFH